MRQKLREKPWYPYAAALCIAVVLYVVLVHIGGIVGGIRTVLSFFSPVFLGMVLAYLMNPLFRLLQERVFRRLKPQQLRKPLALTLTVLAVLLLIASLLLTAIPQLGQSISSFVANLDNNVESLEALLNKRGITLGKLDLDQLLQQGTDLIKKNVGTILNTTVTVGKVLGSFFVSFLLSIYLLAEKQTLGRGVKQLLHALLSEKHYQQVMRFTEGANAILERYIVYSLLECLIVGAANAVFMLIAGMSYTPLVSFVVALTNLIPTFGPVIGLVVGGLILLLSRPIHALWFLLFTLVLQTIDGYVIKPKLFGNSLGVSGLWILIAIIIGGKMFGVVGMLLAIPCAAILDDLYHDHLVPWLEERRSRREGSTE